MKSTFFYYLYYQKNAETPSLCIGNKEKFKQKQNMHMFIDYWDQLIKDWFIMGCSVNKYYPEQNIFKSVSYDYLPEPYMGDPDNCSFVIVNYNPGGGDNLDPHIYLKCANNCCSIPTLIKFVKNNSYSQAVMDFPLLQNPVDLITKGWVWFLSYSGYQWWQQKKEWLNNIARSAGIKTIDEGLMPFAIELCAWHSPKWNPKNVKSYNTQAINIVMDTIIYAMSHSKGKLAVFIGKEHINVITKHGYSPICSSFQPDPSVNRFYQVFEHTKTKLPAIVTWVSGSNKHPGKSFYSKETTIINNTKKHKSPIYP